ncbi:hypothetical protein [Methylorubrum salsuginis]|uniref:Uncharacterized protein n=1 Tax=Methylorubrum salsuginis TaxID=414703 RepID=A0A1I4GGZ6_9HYPH|nr:hypothetical protein [Methylorubrum salsuginis]SFL29129.1 hypothetical protein SAMN04488125_11239 [Methylorubrum salsuginis]
MAAGSRLFSRGSKPIPWGAAAGRAAGLACALALALVALPGGHGPVHGAIDPTGIVSRAPISESGGAPPESAPTRIVLGPGGRDVRLAGELTEGVAERLARLLDAHGSVERIHLTSEGGLVDEGAAIGALIARRGLVTYVPDYCVSACTLAFVRGRERLVLEGARLGFHAPYETGPFGIEVAADSTPERAAYLEAGLEPAFVDAALKVRPDDLMIPDTARLVAARVATGVVDAYRFPDSTLDESSDPDHARAVVLRDVPLLADVEARAPALIRAISAWYLDGYAQGRSEGAAYDGIRRMAARAVAGALRPAEPATLVALGQLTLRLLDRFEPDRAPACAAAGEGIGAVLTRSGIGEAERASARAALSNASFAEAMPDDSIPASRATRDCAGLRRALAAALALPADDAAAALHPLLFPEPALAHVTAQAE